MPATAIPAALGSCAWEALGTSVVMRVIDPGALDAARAAVERELATIERTCSRFVLDPPVAQPRAAPAVTLRVRSGWRTIALNRASCSMLMPAGVRLDLGASAKAWAADRAAAAAQRASGCGVLVSLGGDIATSGPAPEDGWQIRVTDDHRSDCSAPGQTVSIHSGGLATSSTSVRRWSHAGQTMHHVIDPSTGAPVRDTWRTISVAAASCTDANIAATATLVRAQAGAAWLARQGLPARLVDPQGTVVAVGDWPCEAAANTLAVWQALHGCAAIAV